MCLWVLVHAVGAAVLAEGAAALGKPCCGPDQWEATVFEQDAAFIRSQDRVLWRLNILNYQNITEGIKDPMNGSFRWDPEHLAELRPVHIDDKDIKRQLSRTSPDHELEERAQQAIDYYFAHHMVAPSPWGQDPPPHVLPVTPAYAKGDYMTHQETDDGNGENMSTSSLRRKLFFNADSSSIFSPIQFSSSPIRGPYYGDGEFLRCSFSDQGALASPELSPIDVLDGEGGSGLDTLQHPSSLSNQDTGYQTASGSGSLQTTQQDGLHHVSNDAGVASGNFDSSSHSASAETKLHLKSEDGPFSINETGLSEKMVAEDSIASPSLDPEKGASHTNLTGQFFSMPFQSELSVESATLETSMQSSFDGGVDSQSLRRARCVPGDRVIEYASVCSVPALQTLSLSRFLWVK
nr:hypothetical protein BaRGS_016256 [Batillaria attramentaria]